MAQISYLLADKLSKDRRLISDPVAGTDSRMRKAQILETAIAAAETKFGDWREVEQGEVERGGMERKMDLR